MTSDNSPESTVEYYERFAKTFHNTGQTIWQHQLDEFHSYLPEGKVLEIGSATGVEANILSQWYEYIGVDAAAACIELAQRNYAGICFQQCDLFELLSLGHKFDGFWSAATLLHVPKSRMREALDVIRGVLNPGAIGFISVKEGDGEEWLLDNDKVGLPARFYSYWHRDELLPILRQAGFVVIEVSQKYTENRLDPSLQVNWLCYYLQAND